MMEGVPKSMIRDRTRVEARRYVESCLADNHDRHEAVIFSQVNARKNGELFESYFLLHFTVLEERPFIIGLQVDGSKVDDPTAYLHSTIENLYAFFTLRNMTQIQTINKIHADGKVLPRVIARLCTIRRTGPNQDQGPRRYMTPKMAVRETSRTPSLPPLVEGVLAVERTDDPDEEESMSWADRKQRSRSIGPPTDLRVDTGRSSWPPSGKLPAEEDADASISPKTSRYAHPKRSGANLVALTERGGKSMPPVSPKTPPPKKQSPAKGWKA
jgi:hypothetical protein